MLAEFITSTALLLGVYAPLTSEPPEHIASGEKIGTMTSRVTGNVPLIQGTTLPILSRGAGHLKFTSLPGEKGVTSWWAHRVTPTLGKSHGPFYNIDKFMQGNIITLRTGWGKFRYRVTRHLIIHKPTVNSLKWHMARLPKMRQYLMIAACHPKGSAAKRYVVVARRITGGQHMTQTSS